MADDLHPLRVALDRMTGRIESGTRALEQRLGRWGAALVVGALLTVVAAFIARPTVEPANHGQLYARLSVAPLAFEHGNWVQGRILTPLVAHGLHLRGRAFVLVPIIAVFLLLSAVYGHYRRVGFAGATAAGMAATLAVSTPVLFPLHFSGYPDPTTTLLLFGCFALPGRPWLRGLFFSLALFNHENALFALPWLILDARSVERPLRRGLVFLGLATLGGLAYVMWRDYVASHVTVRFTVGFYLRPERIARNLGRVEAIAPLGAFESFRLLWFFPLLAAFDAWRGRAWRVLLFLVAIVGGAAAQLVVAHDVSRLMGLAFPAVLLGAELCRQRYGEEWLTRWLWLLVLLTLLVPAYDVTPGALVPLLPYWWPSLAGSGAT